MTAFELLARTGALGIRLWLDGEQLRYEAPLKGGLTPEILEELRRNRSEIISILRSANVVQDWPSIPPGTPCPLSPAQQRFYFVDRLEEQSTSYNLSSAFTLEGDLNIPALLASIRTIVTRHEILRTRFVFSHTKLTQVVTDWLPVMQFIDLSALPSEQQWPAANNILQRESSRPFDVPDGPHIRVGLIRLSKDTHIFCVSMHHIVSDGGSIEPFVHELHICYEAYRHSREPLLEPLPVQYREVAYWQHQNRESTAGQLDYWRERLAGAPPLVQLPLSRPRPTHQTFNGSSIRVAITEALETKLHLLREKYGFTAFNVFLGAFFVLLQKYSRQDDIVVGVPVSNRTNQKIATLIGPFLNMTAIRILLAGSLRLNDVVEYVRQAVIEAVDQAGVPFEDVVAALAPQRSSSYSPLFNVMFVLEDAPLGILNLAGLKTTTLHVPSESAKYDLTLVIQRDTHGLNAWFKYNPDLFDPEVIERMAAHYLKVLEAMAGDIECPLSRLCLLTASEWQTQIHDWNNTGKEFLISRCTHELFEERVEETPHAIALDFEDDLLTYAELNRKANQIAHHLIALGVGIDSIVAIRAERSLEMVIAVLGVLKAGAAYVPIDPEYPRQRQEFMIEDALAPVFLSQRKLAGEPFSGNSRLVVIEDVLESNSPLHRYNPGHRAELSNAAYVIYTSGSTGLPKGVITDHGAILNNLLWMQQEWPIGKEDVFLLKAAFSFDVSFKEILWPLMFGAKLVIATPGGHRDPEYLHSVIARKKVTVIHLVPTMLEYFLSGARAIAAESLRIVMCGGEALSLDLKQRFCERFKAGLLHLYGPTEASIAVTGVLFTKNDNLRTIVLGRPTANCQIYLLDEDLNPVPVGASGEIFIGGVGLARCYHRRPELTAERFLPDPFGTKPGMRLYRTGDLARYLPDGNLQFVGRIDFQVKLHGLRLELSEVESALRKHPAVADTLVIVHTDDAGVKKLIAYFVPALPDFSETHALLDFLRQQLPSYMVPAAFISVDSIPMSSNGKADRTALPRPALNGIPKPALEPPRTSVEQRLMTLWKEVLGVQTLSVHDHFFEVGGRSITLLELQKKIETNFQRSIRITDLFQSPTVASMAALLSAPPSVPASESGRRGVLPIAAHDDAVAIIGLAGRFPGANDVDQFWDVVAGGRQEIRFFSEEELIANGCDPQLVRRPNYVKARGYVDGLDLFDPEFFHYTQTEALILDPQTRLLLECTQHAFDDAGYDPTRFGAHGASVGVYVSASRSSYYLNQVQWRPDLLETMGPTQVAIAADKGFAATHLAYRFDFKGPAVTVDTACSSSLVAVHHACASLNRGECALAIAGGASIDAPLKSGYPFVEGGIGSFDGHCRPFDASASGTVKGMGGGVVLLKRLKEAVSDGDYIYAVIRGSGLNNDGAAKVGFTAPSGNGQTDAILRAIAAAGIEPSEIGFIEAHGTGTVLGDPIEFAALSKVLSHGRIALGAVKGNIGHLDSASGIAGLIKTALVLDRRLIPPLAGFTQPNSEISLAGSAFYIPQMLTDWTAQRGSVRHAGVSSFGIGGTNVHAILSEAPERIVATATNQVELLCFSGRNFESLHGTAEGIADYVARNSQISLQEISFTLNSRRQFDCRHAGLFSDPREFIAAVRAGSFPKEIRRPSIGSPVRLVVAFGPGSIPVHWLEDTHYDRLYGALDEGQKQIIARFLSTGLRNEPQWVRDAITVVAGHALLERLCDLGMRPDIVAGFEAGECAAACAAGMITLETAVQLALLRASNDIGRQFALELRTRSVKSPTIPLWTKDASVPADVEYWLMPDTRTPFDESLFPNDVVLFLGDGPSPSNWIKLPGSASNLETALMSVIGQLWECGVTIDWPRYYETRAAKFGSSSYRRVSLPGYAFNRRRFWIDAVRSPSGNPPVYDQPSIGIQGWVRAPLYAGSPSRSDWLVFYDESALAEAIVSRLRSSGEHVTLVRRGESFRFSEYYEVNQGHPSEFEMLLRAVPSASRVLDFWSRSDPWAPVVFGLARAGWKGRIGVVAQNALAVIGNEPLDDSQAPLAALPAMIAKLGIDCTVLDVDGEMAASHLQRELSGEAPAARVAYRNGHRWLPCTHTVSLSELAAAGVPPPGKRHLIADGLTPLGLLIAEHLAQIGVDRIVITHRDVIPPGTNWREMASEPKMSGFNLALSRLLKLEQQGVDVQLLRIDDHTQLADLAQRECGRIDAVYFDLVSAEQPTLYDSSSLKFHMNAMAGLLKLQQLDFLVAFCSAADSNSEHPLTAAARTALSCHSHDTLPRRIVVTSDIWSADGVRAADLVPVMFDVIPSLFTMDCAAAVHLSAESLRMIQTHFPRESSDDAASKQMTSLERKILRVWKQLLGVPGLTAEDDFFAAGGDSLMVTQAASRLADLLELPVSPTLIYDEPTVRSLATVIEEILRTRSQIPSSQPGEREELIV